MSIANNYFKLNIIGDAGVGKTTYITRFLTGEFTTRYEPTLGVSVDPLTFSTNVGKIGFNIWDQAGQERFQGGYDKYLAGSSGVLLMFDLTSKLSLKNIKAWYNMVKSVDPQIRMILCGNKSDCKDKKVTANDIIKVIQELGNINYIEISSKSNYNYEKPFLWFAKKLIGAENLTFVEGPAVNPPEVN